MEIIKQVNNKTLVRFNDDTYLKQCDYRLIKEYKNSFAVTDYHVWYSNNQRTSRKRGNTEYYGKGFITLLNSLNTKG